MQPSAFIAPRPVCAVVLSLAFCALLGGKPAPAAAAELPFRPGERLSYQISWSLIPAARLELEVAPPEELGTQVAYHFVMKVRTLPVVDLIYPYQERIDSYVAANVDRSLFYKKWQESSHPRDIAVQFDWDRGEARYSNFGQAIAPIPIQPGTLDPLAALYYIRAFITDSQPDLERSVTDGKKLSMGKARFIAKETLTIFGKTYHTIKIEPDLHEVGGVFEKSPGAKMFLWLTDDERKTLVKFKSKVIVGSFVAELVADDSVIPE